MESSVGESSVGRADPARFQHTLAGQMVAERDLKTAENLLCVGNMGAHVCDVRHCGFSSGSRPNSLVLGDGGWPRYVVPLDTTTKIISCSSPATAAA